MRPTTTIFTAMLVVLAFAACSKKNDGNSHFDPTKFYITGTVEDTGIDSTSYAFLFLPNGAAVAVSARKTTNPTYEFQNGHLKLMSPNSSEGFDFTIENDRIINASALTHTMDLPYTYVLQKIPRTDYFKGKTFKGQLNNSAISVSFGNDGTFEISQIRNDLTIAQKGNYNLQNNAVAKASVQSIHSVLFIMLDGKLAISTADATGTILDYAVLDQAN
jgi:hypothetical protein